MTPAAPGAWPGAPPSLAGFMLDLLLAALLGGLVGLQRQATHKPAGFRTHLLVALGSCAFMEVSRLAGDDRIAANIITGVGFLGAGAIVREGALPRGLTSAASVWAVSAIGMALGFGTRLSWELAATETLLVLAALAFSDDRLRGWLQTREALDIAVTFDPHVLDFEEVATLFAVDGVHVSRTDRLTLDNEHGASACWHLVLRSKHRARVRAAALAASRTDGILRVDTMLASQP